MKTLNYKLLLLLLFISSVIYSCSNEDSLIPSPPPPIENNVITRSNGVVLDMPYISRPDLLILQVGKITRESPASILLDRK